VAVAAGAARGRRVTRRGTAFVGTSGWSYDRWRDDFYRGVRRRDWLRHAARQFSGLEINATFYRLPSPETLRRWAAETPAGFRFTLKGHRLITHSKRLRDVGDNVARSREPARALGARLAAVVWQLPDTLGADLERLRGFVRALGRWRSTRHALELRHPSWFRDDVAALLAEANLAVCWSDAPDFPMWRRVTTDLVYVRLHGHTRKYASRYSGPSLRRWAERVAGWTDEGRDVHVYFDNDAEGAAPRDALSLLELLQR
jgi:uncharacterized protein YecE (DUF72 family)